MGKGMELITGFVTGTTTDYTGLTMASGNSLTIRSAKEGSKVYLLQAWIDLQTANILRIRSPRMHDNVRGLEFSQSASNLKPFLPFGTKQIMISQDTLVAEIGAVATASDIETACMLMYYEDLQGVEGRFITEEDLWSRMKHMKSVINTISLGTAGGYSGEEAINAETDLLKANTDYAIVGYHVSAQCAAVRWRGSDFGNLGVGGPGGVGEHWLTPNWFLNLARRTGLACIPVFNSANRANLLVDGAQDENGTDTTVTTILAELS